MLAISQDQENKTQQDFNTFDIMESINRNEATMAQIRRLEDASLNPLTGTAWPAGHDNILQGRRKLPVYERSEEILGAYHQNQVFLLSSETGSGKSTQVPQLLVYDESSSGLRIACTQPRRLAAAMLATRVAQEMGVVLGEEVGYQIGGFKKVNKNKKKTRLAYMTEGVLLGKQASDKLLLEYACIIIDEVHERTVEADMLMATLKKILLQRKDFKVVILSATMDAKLFQDYFNECPVVQITGRTFQVDIRCLKSGEGAFPDFTVMAANTALDIHRNEEAGHILVFAPGQGEINRICELIRKYAEDLDVFPLYSALTSGEQHAALDSSSAKRKCIVSTNIAETSLTIDNVVYVIDTGLSRQMVCNPRLGMNMLQLRPISQASAKQRTGRAGRTRDGVCYRLYTKEDFDRMMLSTDPAIRCSRVHSAVLRLVSAGEILVADYDWVTAPHPESLARAAQDLQSWGFLQDDGRPTPSGRMAAQCPLDPIWYLAIQEGAKLNCAMEIVDIAILSSSSRSIFEKSPKQKQAADVLRRGSVATSPSDHLALLNAFRLYTYVLEKHQEHSPPKFNLGAWCKAHFLDMNALEEVRRSRLSLGPFLKNVAKIPPTYASVTDTTSVRKALAIAFCTQTALFFRDGDDYRTIHENISGRLEPTSALVNGNHEWIVYTTLNQIGRKVYLDLVTPINAEWLVDLPYFQEDQLALKKDGSLRQPMVKQSLDAARARIEASKTN